jgi:hypothetical protein
LRKVASIIRTIITAPAEIVTVAKAKNPAGRLIMSDTLGKTRDHRGRAMLGIAVDGAVALSLSILERIRKKIGEHIQAATASLKRSLNENEATGDNFCCLIGFFT